MKSTNQLASWAAVLCLVYWLFQLGEKKVPYEGSGFLTAVTSVVWVLWLSCLVFNRIYQIWDTPLIRPTLAGLGSVALGVLLVLLNPGPWESVASMTATPALLAIAVIADAVGLVTILGDRSNDGTIQKRVEL